MASSSGRRSSSSASRPSGGKGPSRRLSGEAYEEGISSRPVRRGVGSGRGAAAARVRVDTLEERPRARGGRRGGTTHDPRRAVYDRKVRRLILAVVLAATALVAYLVVVYSGIFAIRSIEAEPTAHVSAEDISRLAAVPEGSTLFSVDEAGIVSRIGANPWVASVDVSRQLPGQLTITVTERTEAAVVMLSSGLSAWRLATDGHWLKEVPLSSDAASGTTDASSSAGTSSSADASSASGGSSSGASSSGVSPADEAKKVAASDGVVFVTAAAPTVAPQAGAACDDDALKGLLGYLTGFSPSMVSQIASADASSLAGLSLVLKSGVEVSVGPAANVADKERVISLLLEQNAGSVTYLNVRDPANPSWRGL